MFMVFLRVTERICLIHLRPCEKLRQSTLLHDDQTFIHGAKWTGAMFGSFWRLPAWVRLARPQSGPVKHNRQWVGGCELSNQQLVKPCLDRKSTRLNSSHANISYAVFC